MGYAMKSASADFVANPPYGSIRAGSAVMSVTKGESDQCELTDDRRC